MCFSDPQKSLGGRLNKNRNVSESMRVVVQYSSSAATEDNAWVVIPVPNQPNIKISCMMTSVLPFRQSEFIVLGYAVTVTLRMVTFFYETVVGRDPYTRRHSRIPKADQLRPIHRNRSMHLKPFFDTEPLSLSPKLFGPLLCPYDISQRSSETCPPADVPVVHATTTA